MKVVSYKVYGGLVVTSLIFICGCNVDGKKRKIIVSGTICNGLTREKYTVGSGGALSAETYADCVTDSVNFRMFIGTHGEDENFMYDCSGDSLYAIRLSVKGVEKARVIDTIGSFSLRELKRKKVFE
jgi:hypothetical protein